MDKLDNILCKFLSSWVGPIFLSSDTNIDALKKTSISKSYIAILEHRGLHQVVTKPNRNGLQKTDHIITNVYNVTVTDVLPFDEVTTILLM